MGGKQWQQMTFAKKIQEVSCLTEAFDSMLMHLVRPKREDVEAYCHEVRLLRLFLLGEGVEEDAANVAIGPYGAKAKQLADVSESGSLVSAPPACRGCGDVPCGCRP